MTIEKTACEVLVVHIGSLDCLDAVFEQLKKSKRHLLSFTPERDVIENALLAATGPRGAGGLYTFVGVLHNIRFEAEDHIAFKKVTRFWCPVVGVYEQEEHRRDDLMGTLQGWSAKGVHYLPVQSFERVRNEAEQLLVYVPRRSRPRR